MNSFSWNKHLKQKSSFLALAILKPERHTAICTGIPSPAYRMTAVRAITASGVPDLAQFIPPSRKVAIKDNPTTFKGKTPGVILHLICVSRPLMPLLAALLPKETFFFLRQGNAPSSPPFLKPFQKENFCSRYSVCSAMTSPVFRCSICWEQFATANS